MTSEQWQALLDSVDTFLFDCDGRKDSKWDMSHPTFSVALATPFFLTRGVAR